MKCLSSNSSRGVDNILNLTSLTPDKLYGRPSLYIPTSLRTINNESQNEFLSCSRAEEKCDFVLDRLQCRVGDPAHGIIALSDSDPWEGRKSREENGAEIPKRREWRGGKTEKELRSFLFQINVASDSLLSPAAQS